MKNHDPMDVEDLVSKVLYFHLVLFSRKLAWNVLTSKVAGSEKRDAGGPDLTGG